MSHPQPPYSGACLCGAVEVTVTAPPLLTFACHCRDCQKFSASAYSLSAMFPADAVTCTGELIRGGLKSAERAHFFCASCLNFVYSQVAGAEHRINLRISLLSDAAQFEPFLEMMTDSRMPWAHVPAAHSFATQPQSPEAVQALMDEFAEQW